MGMIKMMHPGTMNVAEIPEEAFEGGWDQLGWVKAPDDAKITPQVVEAPQQPEPAAEVDVDDDDEDDEVLGVPVDDE